RIAKSAGRTLKRLHEGMLEWRLAGLPVDEPQPRAG
ncbi:MAG TPA: ArsR family transcriptional regulator, partial [Mycobacterium sp.]|nr:ArsR family transcriptional regulator [Mycobacterium sp.]